MAVFGMWIGLAGCSAVAPPHEITPPPPTVGIDTKVSRTLAQDEARRFQACNQDQTCDRDHFTSALLALAENPQAAVVHFRHVVTDTPQSRLAELSAAGLRTLEADSKEGRKMFEQANRQLLLEFLDRESALKHEVSQRDKKLDELSRQLKALKQINLEMKEKRYPMKPRMNLTAPPDSTD